MMTKEDAALPLLPRSMTHSTVGRARHRFATPDILFPARVFFFFFFFFFFFRFFSCLFHNKKDRGKRNFVIPGETSKRLNNQREIVSISIKDFRLPKSFVVFTHILACAMPTILFYYLLLLLLRLQLLSVHNCPDRIDYIPPPLPRSDCGRNADDTESWSCAGKIYSSILVGYSNVKLCTYCNGRIELATEESM